MVIWKSPVLSASVDFPSKKVVCGGQILRILMYECESWCLTEKLLNMLRSFYSSVWAMRRVNRFHVRTHRITTEELLDRLGLKQLDVYVHRRQL